MQHIVMLKGRVAFSLTLDPSSWIFDDRKIDINDFYADDFDLDTFLEAQKDERAGAAIPRLAKGQRKYKKDEWLIRSFAMPAKIFIDNAEPQADASLLTFELTDGETISIPLEEARDGLLAFSHQGKIISDEGPLHFYFKNNPNAAIKGICGLNVQ
ncbi:hypothetical protein GCM10011391_19700 [Pullulanibacillus camelliae]|uniref:Peptidyl-prolyl cis-trans isomerase n=1 Tax=Pullulanibacillus camelliae TaxID=1707096 RepID=A0A8J2YDV1_9BACL|nr:peptidyl-prolyl cis-trans isomerase [Pullulanibacillus camelliae]GGE41017.1 hypothetical protein GCM10011391_19700 [Pullulanibacillus camelliae]